MKVNLLYELDNLENYCYNSKYVEGLNISINDNNDLSEMIVNNYDKMTDEEIKNIVTKCLSINQMKSIILKYELENYKNKVDLDFPEFIKYVNKLIHRYHYKAGGFYLEDNKWKLHDKNSNKYDLKNCVIFENSINTENISDIETNIFLELLVSRINELSDKYIAKLKLKEKNKIIWVLIKIKLIN